MERIDAALIGEAAKQIAAANVFTDRAVIEAPCQGMKVRIWRDASEAVRLNDFEAGLRASNCDQARQAASRPSRSKDRLSQF